MLSGLQRGARRVPPWRGPGRRHPGKDTTTTTTTAAAATTTTTTTSTTDR